MNWPADAANAEVNNDRATATEATPVNKRRCYWFG